MKIVRADLPDSYLKLVKNSCICEGIYIPEHVRLRIREELRQELILAGELENELEDKLKLK